MLQFDVSTFSHFFGERSWEGSVSICLVSEEIFTQITQALPSATSHMHVLVLHIVEIQNFLVLKIFL